MHAFVPPHPGPVAASDLLGADIGLLLVTGLPLAVITWYLGAYLYSRYAGNKFVIPVPTLYQSKSDEQVSNPPSFATVMTVLLVPVCLIFLDTGLNSLQVAGYIAADQAWVDTLRMLGNTPVALLLTLLLCLALFTHRFGKANMEKLCTESLAPICAVILVTGAGECLAACCVAAALAMRWLTCCQLQACR